MSTNRSSGVKVSPVDDDKNLTEPFIPIINAPKTFQSFQNYETLQIFGYKPERRLHSVGLNGLRSIAARIRLPLENENVTRHSYGG